MKTNVPSLVTDRAHSRGASSATPAAGSPVRRLTLLALMATLLANCAAEAALFKVTNTADGGPGSLRQAIADANLRKGPDKIEFAIPGKGPFTIHPATPLPPIADPLDLSAEGKPVSLDSSGLAWGLKINSSDCSVRALPIHAAYGPAISAKGPTLSSLTEALSLIAHPTGRVVTGSIPKADLYDTTVPTWQSGGAWSWDNYPIPGGGGDDYAFRAVGVMNVPAEGDYLFTLGSDDGSQLLIDGTEVASAPDPRAFALSYTTVHLTAGQHDLTWIGYQQGGGAGFEVSVATGDLPWWWGQDWGWYYQTYEPGWSVLGDPTAPSGVTLAAGLNVTVYYLDPQPLKNITIDLGGKSLNGDWVLDGSFDGVTAGISMDRAAGLRIKNGTVRGFYPGIDLGNCSDVDFSGLLVTGNVWGSRVKSTCHDVRIRECAYSQNGVGCILGGAHHEFKNNSLTDNQASALGIDDLSDSLIQNNDVLRNGLYNWDTYGYAEAVVSGFSVRNCVIEGNRINGNTEGVLVFFGNNNIIRNNECNHNSHGLGLWMDSSSNNSILGNQFNDNGTRGLLMDYFCTSNEIAGNEFSRNTIGLELSTFVADNLVQNNVADGNSFFGMGITFIGVQNTFRLNTARNNGQVGIGIEQCHYLGDCVFGNTMESNTSFGNGTFDLFDNSSPVVTSPAADSSFARASAEMDQEREKRHADLAKKHPELKARFEHEREKFEKEHKKSGPPSTCLNLWNLNKFLTDSEGDGPGAGCIQ